jgi:hypothetical protein
MLRIYARLLAAALVAIAVAAAVLIPNGDSAQACST